MRLAINYSQPDLAAGVAVFGIGLLALPFLARLNGLAVLAGAGCGLVEGDGVFSYEAHVRRNAKKIRACDLDRRDLKRRFGELDVAFMAKEISLEAEELDGRMEQAGEEATGGEATQIQQWRNEVNGHLALLKKRSAFSFLGLAPESSEADVQKRYKKMAFELHPDKGGDHAKFKELQAMRDRLVERKADEGDAGAGAGAGADGGDDDDLDDSESDDWDEDEDSEAEEARRERRRRKKKKREEEEAKRVEEAGVFNWRRDMHDALVRLWDSAGASSQEIASGSLVLGNSHSALNILRAFIDRFVSSEVENEAPMGDAEAEAKFAKFVRQGAEIIPVAAIVDSEATMSTLAMHFNYRLLSRSNTSGMKARCAALLEAALEVPTKVRELLRALSDCCERRLERKRKAQEQAEAAEAAAQAGEPEPEAAEPRPEGSEPAKETPPSKRRRIVLDWSGKLQQEEAPAGEPGSGAAAGGEGSTQGVGQSSVEGRGAESRGGATGSAPAGPAAKAKASKAEAKSQPGKKKGELPGKVADAPPGQSGSRSEGDEKENSNGNIGPTKRRENDYKGPLPFKRARTMPKAVSPPAPVEPPPPQAEAPAEPPPPGPAAGPQPLARLRSGARPPAAGPSGAGKARAGRAATRPFVVRGSGVPQSLGPGRGGEEVAEAEPEGFETKLQGGKLRAFDGSRGEAADLAARAAGERQEQAKREKEDKMVKRTERLLQRLEEREERRQVKLRKQEQERMDKWARKWMGRHRRVD